MSEQQTTPTSKRTRSPNYPYLDLKEGIAKAKLIWDADSQHPVSVESLAIHWNYTPKSSSLLKVLAALKHYGLLQDSNGEHRLSDDAVRILSNEDQESQERLALIKKCALKPTLYSDLWIKYGGKLPSDVTLKSYLIADLKFNKDVVSGAIDTFRSTIAFAKLSESDIVTEKEDMAENTITPPKISREPLGQFVYPKPANQPPDTLAPPIRPVQRGSNLSLPLGNGDFVVIPKMSKDDFDLFLETLKLWEKKLILTPPPKESFPFVVMWKNKDFDKMVKIVAALGEQDGEKYYQSEDGTGIPASEIFPDAPK